MRTVRILAIGNSFSEDALRYLHPIAAAEGIDAKVVNLCIGGCSLERHWLNVEKDAKAYRHQVNGFDTERTVSVPEILAEEDWDFIVSQQASHDSGWLDSYQPFAPLLFGYLKSVCPRAECLIHQTWAYERDSLQEAFARYGRSQAVMFDRLASAYRLVSQELGLRLIPCGEAIQAVRACGLFDPEAGGRPICRDGYHLSLLHGRYLASLMWAATLFDRDPTALRYAPEPPWAPDGEAIAPSDHDLIRSCAATVHARHRSPPGKENLPCATLR